MDEELRVLRGELSAARAREQQSAARVAALEAEVTRLTAETADAWEQIRRMRRTVAWRAGRPVRAARRWLSAP